MDRPGSLAVYALCLFMGGVAYRAALGMYCYIYVTLRYSMPGPPALRLHGTEPAARVRWTTRLEEQVKGQCFGALINAQLLISEPATKEIH